MYHFFRHTIFYCTRHTFKLHTTLLYKINYSSPHSKLDTKHERQTVSCRTPLSLSHFSTLATSSSYTKEEATDPPVALQQR